MADIKVSNLIVGITSDEKQFAAGADSSTKALQHQKQAAKAATKEMSGLKSSLKESTTAAKHHASALGKVVSAIKRIAFYRMIRSAIKAVTQAFSEGVKNLYQYSAALNSLDAARAKNTMDAFATTALYVKNSLGAALMPVLQALLPVVNAIANAFVTAANAVNQFFHALKGESVFTRAKKYATEFGDALGGAAGKAKELKKQIFGFDELNIFNEPSSGGGGGGSGMDYSQMFEEAKVSDILANVRAFMDLGLYRQAGESLAKGLNYIIKQFDAASFGKNLGKKIENGIKFAVGFVSDFDFSQVGTKVGEAINNLFYQIKFEEIGEIIANLLTGAFDFAIGLFTSLDFGYAAESISKLIISLFDNLSEWLLEVDWEGFGRTFFTQVYDFVTGIDFGGIASAFFRLLGEAFGSALLLFRGFTDGLIERVNLYFDRKTEECGGNVILGFLKGIKDAIKGIFEWINTNIVQPVIDGFNSAFGFNTSASEMNKAGTKAINDFFAGMKAAWTAVATWISTKANAVKTTFQNLINGVKNFRMDSPRYIDYGVAANLFAEGGTPQTGTLFWAGEAGPELVGQVGGKTTVTNQDQFTAGMEGIMDNTNSVIMQAASALIQAIQNKDMTSIVSIGDRDIVASYDRGKRLAGASLVE